MKHVPDIAAVEIDRLRKDGINLTDDDVVWLASLGYKIENPKGRTLEAAGIVDGITLSNGEILNPLTVAASKWLGKYGNLFPDRGDIYAVAFAMIYPNRVSVFKSAKESIEAVGQWGDNLKISHSELVAAVSRMLSGDAPRDPERKTVDTDKLLATLVAVTGLPFEYWDKQSWVKVNNVYLGALKYAMMMRDSVDNPDADESREAVRNLLLAINTIRKKRRCSNG